VQNFLYVIGVHSSGPVKLGISKNPDRRVRQLQTGHSDRLHLFHTEPVPEGVFERLLHNNLRHRRLRGEWFDLTVEQAIADVMFVVIEHGGSVLDG